MLPIVHEPSAHRFVLTEADGFAEVTYEATDQFITVTHTFVPPSWRGRGVAAELLKALLTWVDEDGRRVRSECSYATAYLSRHSEYDHLQAPESA